MYHVKEYPYPVPGNLDLNIADEEEFSPDKLRANVERLYMTVIISFMGSGKQVVRLRSWRETRRTSCFATVSRALNPQGIVANLSQGLLPRLDVRLARTPLLCDPDRPYRVPSVSQNHVPPSTARAC